MPRKSSVWYREEDGWYYTTIKREQVRLSQDETEAQAEFDRLMAEQLSKPRESPTRRSHPTEPSFVEP
jgi:hypothetical protein